MSEKYTKEQILELLRNNEDDYYVLPHYGLISDWYKRYWQLHNIVLEYFDQDPF